MTEFYGIGASQKADKADEILNISGLDIDAIKSVTDEHSTDQNGVFGLIGGIRYAKKIFTEKDCVNPRQRRCWQEVKVPFLYVEGKLMDGESHPNAQAAAALLKFAAANPDFPLRPGLSIEGSILERSGSNKKLLSKTMATGVALTIKPANTSCRVFLMNDLQKSEARSLALPEVYFEAMKKNGSLSGFRDVTNILADQLAKKVESLKKSLENFRGGETSHMNCERCGENVRFFKHARNIPHRCSSCGSAFSMSQLFRAMNK